MKYTFLTFFLFFIASCTHYCNSPFKDTDFKTATITNTIISNNEGYGYEIWVDGKKYINQNYIPSIRPFKRFTNAEDAQKVADLTIEKLRKEIIPPYIKEKEIEELGIEY